MANINDEFPSKYLKASDLKRQHVMVTIDRLEHEVINNERKLILYFEGKEKGIVLNKTNARNIADAYGEEMDDWSGQKIILFEAMVDFQGKTVPAIRIRRPLASDKKGKQPKPAPMQDNLENPAEGMNDQDVPF